jgi:hypothetical protein
MAAFGRRIFHAGGGGAGQAKPKQLRIKKSVNE